MTSPNDALILSADVLVIGGGPAATWAAVTAAATGAQVALVDKGYCGTSGCAATAGMSHWFIPPDPALREAAMHERSLMGAGMPDSRWMARVLDETWRRLPELADAGYRFPRDDSGAPLYRHVQGPEYMRRMRRRVRNAGVTILDHSPALELLVDPLGAVAGARGVSRQTQRDWTIQAGAVVLACGGCAWLSGVIGLNVNTGDGLLMAAEAGAELSGMEFSNWYGPAPVGGNVTKGMLYTYASYYNQDGTPLEGAPNLLAGRLPIARALSEGRAVYAQLDKADESVKPLARHAQPHFFLMFDRMGIDPFTQRFRFRWMFEGTVRGTGGLRVVADDCSTTVPGLYVAGDTASRENVSGAGSGGGNHNAAWAVSSGSWAGRAAAAHAKRERPDGNSARPVGGAGLTARERPADAGLFSEVVRAVQGELFPYERNLFRTGSRLHASLEVLDDCWSTVRDRAPAAEADRVRARETTAMVAAARWAYRSALAREETRGMHYREDFPHNDPGPLQRVVSGGLDEVWTAREPLEDREEIAA